MKTPAFGGPRIATVAHSLAAPPVLQLHLNLAPDLPHLADSGGERSLRDVVCVLVKVDPRLVSSASSNYMKLRGKVGFPKKACFLVFHAHPDTAEPRASKLGAVG